MQVQAGNNLNDPLQRAGYVTHEILHAGTLCSSKEEESSYGPPRVFSRGHTEQKRVNTEPCAFYVTIYVKWVHESLSVFHCMYIKHLRKNEPATLVSPRAEVGGKERVEMTSL